MRVVPDVGFELTTYCLQDSCSTTELIRHAEMKAAQPIFELKNRKNFVKVFQNADKKKPDLRNPKPGFSA
jgi:hypothetical protein